MDVLACAKDFKPTLFFALSTARSPIVTEALALEPSKSSNVPPEISLSIYSPAISFVTLSKIELPFCAT